MKNVHVRLGWLTYVTNGVARFTVWQPGANKIRRLADPVCRPFSGSLARSLSFF
jgi:hypothetical protein